MNFFEKFNPNIFNKNLGSSQRYTTYNNDCSTSVGQSLALKNACGELWIDTNGKNKPNTLGKDIFEFYLTKYGIIPFGSTLDSKYQFDTSCKDSSADSGDGCTAWVMYNGNEDYLHCNDLSWNGKTKCS